MHRACGALGRLLVTCVLLLPLGRTFSPATWSPRAAACRPGGARDHSSSRAASTRGRALAATPPPDDPVAFALSLSAAGAVVGAGLALDSIVGGESERGESERGTWTIAQLINGVAFAMLSGPSSSGPPCP